MAVLIPDTVTLGGRNLPLSRARQEWQQQLEGSAAYWEKEIFSFLLSFTGDQETLSLHTSGTTGRSVLITARKEQLLASARHTLLHLHLQPGDKALLCLPVRYIAGKMMIVRALAGGLDLYPVRPAATPAVERAYDFAAMTPLQAGRLLQAPGGRERLARIRILLLGGGPLSPQLEKELSTLDTVIFHTYGMTETFSHIAMRRITGEQHSSLFTPLPGIRVTLSPAGTLEIHAPHLSGTPYHTNDLAVIDDQGRFRITGRSDNIINTGGIKISPEELETSLQEQIPWPFFLSGIPDPLLGEKITIILRKKRLEENDLTLLREASRTIRPPAHRPRQVIATAQFIFTESGKLQRNRSKELAIQKGTFYAL
jgi:O-succinylbenzoic acid--CoA ligase